MAQTLAEKLEQIGLSKKESVASALQSEQLAWTPEPSLSKEKGTDPLVHITRS